jgi:tRNA G10  N-methylase Trm11
VIQGSVFKVNLPDHAVDCIITSPPYGVESLSYLRTHLLSYRTLGLLLGQTPYHIHADVIGSEYIGSPVEGSSDFPLARQSQTFNRFFARIGHTNDLQSKKTRNAMMMQFFEDMARCGESFGKWLKPGGQVAFVIGNKRLGPDLIPSDAIVSELFEANGLARTGSIRHKLKWNNSNSEVPWQERTIQDESVLLFRRL